MRIYILRAFPNAHKWYPDAWVIGYFTNKAALQKAITQNWATLGGYQWQDFCRAFHNYFCREDTLGNWRVNPDMYLECGEIEVAVANEYGRD